MSAIWRRAADEWQLLPASAYANEDELHSLVEEAPHLLPLSGDPTLTVVGREVALGAGYADLVAIESDGRLSVIEIKLKQNREARRAVVAQVLTYAAFLKDTSVEDVERRILASHLGQRSHSTLREAAREADETGTFDEDAFDAGLANCLATGAFRLVLVLDTAPPELVQLVGYLDAVSAGVIIDLVTVASYHVGEEQILVPQRVDPEHAERAQATAVATVPTTSRKKLQEIDGADTFAESVSQTDGVVRATLDRLLAWATDLESRKLATLKTVLGTDRQILLVWLPGEKAGLVSIWNDNGAYISLWRSVFARFAWEHIEPIEGLSGKPIGQGTTITNPDDGLLASLAAAYETAVEHRPEWDGRTYYVCFGEGDSRDWDDAREFGFVSAGGGAWYSKTLKQLNVGDRVFVYIPQSSGVGGFVGLGDVTGPAVLADEFVVQRNGADEPLTAVAHADMTHGGATDPDRAEWVVPVRWIRSLPREDAIKDSDLFANQNTAAKLTHGYTLHRLNEAFSPAAPQL